MKNAWFYAAVIIIIIFGGAFILSDKKESLPLPPNIEYYWGETCPHCKNVEEFLNSWDKKDKITINKFETYKNRKNAERLTQRARSCNIPPSEIGVPLIFTPEGKCIIGDDPAINYFKTLNL